MLVMLFEVFVINFLDGERKFSVFDNEFYDGSFFGGLGWRFSGLLIKLM